VQALGTEVIGAPSYCERWIAAFADIRFQKGILTPRELAAGMQEIERR
jgi:hypothetical protein